MAIKGMTNEELLFDSVFKEDGGLFKIDEPNKLGESLLILKNYIIEDTQCFLSILRNRYKNLPEINFNIINNITINACAVKKENGYYVGINEGTILVLFDMFSKMLSTKTIYPHIGNAELESNEKLKIDRFIYEDAVFFNQYRLNPKMPNDPIRAMYGILLSNDSYKFHHSS